MIMYLVDSITKLLDKQTRRVKAHTLIRKTRAQKNKPINEKRYDTVENMSKKFIIAMDNYFTRPKVIAALSDMDVGVVGTSRFTKSWPPTSLKKIKDAHFNEFFYTIDEHGTLVARWMDNGMVFCVSTVHRIGQTIKSCRRKPRVTPKNKTHVDKIWGDKGKMDIEISRLIDDYNHRMGGVDLSDQHISYYHPNLRCRRNWIPMFIQKIPIVRSNAYIIHKNYFKSDALSHKVFTLEMISCLMKRALDDKDHPTSSATQSLVSSIKSTPPSTKQATVMLKKRMRKKEDEMKERHKRMRMSVKKSLDDAYPDRKALPMTLHKRVNGGKGVRAACAYCEWNYHASGAYKTKKWTQYVNRTTMMCYYCSAYLCHLHFDLFHSVSGMPLPQY